MWLEATYHIYPSYGFSSPPIKIVKSFLMLIMACCQSWVGNSGPGTVPLEQGVNKKLDTLLSLLLAFFFTVTVLPPDKKQLTHTAEKSIFINFNSERLLTVCSQSYSWWLLSMKISSKLNEGILKKSIFCDFFT